jgi:hypothetical protein
MDHLACVALINHAPPVKKNENYLMLKTTARSITIRHDAMDHGCIHMRPCSNKAKTLTFFETKQKKRLEEHVC